MIRKVAAGLFAATCLLAVEVPASGASGPPGPPQRGFYMAEVPGAGFMEAVKWAYAHNTSDSVLPTLQAMLDHARQGYRVSLPGVSRSPSAEITELREVIASLSGSQSTGSSPNYSPTPSPSGQGPAVNPSPAPLASTALDPFNFPIRGYSCYSNTTWCQLVLEIAGEYCNGFGCTQTDLIKSTVTINPGAVTSRINYTNLYSPNGGHFSQVHFQIWVLLNNNSAESPQNYNITSNGSSYVYVSNGLPQNGNYIGHGIALWGYFAPTASWIDDNARSGSAKCNTSNNSCYY